MKLTIAQRCRLLVWLKRRGFGFPVRTVRAIHKTGIHPAQAAVLLLKETGGGRNVFGCDHGPGRAFCHEPVTRARVQALRHSRFRNGIGPCQLTADVWVERAGWDRVHRPLVNMVAGFSGFRSMVNDSSVWRAARAYNGSDSYADDFVKRLGGVTRSMRGARVI